MRTSSSRRRRPALVTGLSLAAGLALAVTPVTSTTAAPAADPDPPRVELPAGFQPEGIATGPGAGAWFGSRVDGDIYRVDLRTGVGRVISQGPGTPSLGMQLDERKRLFVAGGTGGDARVVDARSGRVLASYQLVRGGDSFINDVILTPNAAWFTDSENAQLFKVPLTAGGPLPAPRLVERVPLRGAWEQAEGLNANGITTTPDGRALLVVNSASGELFKVQRATGRATKVVLKGTRLTNGDGLLREGRTLYAVQNRLDRVAVVRLTADGRAGRLDHRISTPDFDVPTTIARSGDGLHLPNARFTTPPTPTTPYWVTRIGVPLG